MDRFIKNSLHSEYSKSVPRPSNSQFFTPSMYREAPRTIAHYTRKWSFSTTLCFLVSHPFLYLAIRAKKISSEGKICRTNDRFRRCCTIFISEFNPWRLSILERIVWKTYGVGVNAYESTSVSESGARVDLERFFLLLEVPFSGTLQHYATRSLS